MTTADFTPSRSGVHVAVIVACTTTLLLGLATQSAAQPLAIGGYTLVRERQVTRTISEYEYRAVVTNGGHTLLPAVRARVVALLPSTTVVDGLLDFEGVPALGTRVSTDTFRVRRPRIAPFSPQELVWTLSINGSFRIGGLSLLRERRVNALVSDFDYSAMLSNEQGAIPGATATVVSASPATAIVEASLSFGAVAAGATRRSSDTFTVRRLRAVPLNPDVLGWTIVPGGQTANQPPVARIAPVGSMLVAQSVVLDGSTSSDPDGSPLSYSWSILARPAGSVAGIQNSTAAVASFTPDRSGSYQVQLAVSDGTASATSTVMLTTANSSPVADAGLPQTAAVGTRITLDGSRSTDVDGDALTYAWSVAERPGSSSSQLSDATAVLPTFLVDAPGSYRFQLVVRDANGAASAPATVTASTVNSPPVANAGPDQSVAGGALVVLSGQASSDADGDPLSYRWVFAQQPVGSSATFSDPTSVSPTFTADRRGTFVARLTVTDPSGAATSDDISVSTANSLPVANAGPDQSAAVTATVTLDGSGSTDVDGDTLVYSWSFTSAPAGSQALLSATDVPAPTFVIDRAGTFVLQLMVADGNGGANADTVVVTTANSRPVANAGPDQSVVVGRTVTLDGRASSDADLDRLTYAWALTATPAGSAATLSDATSAQPTFVAERPGTYVAQLTVSDGVLTSTTDTVAVTTGNTAPVANAGTDPSRAALGGQVSLDGIASADADGHALTFSWSLLSQPAGGSAVLVNAEARTPTFVPNVGGDYVAQLIVNDGYVDSAPDTVTVRINLPPVADAGPDRTGAAGALVPLSGSGTDANGDPLTFAWTLFAPPGSASTLANELTATPSFTPDIAGSYTARLVVNDGFNASAPDDAVVTVTVTQALTVTPSTTSMATLAVTPLTISTTQPAGPGGLAVTLTSSDAGVGSVPTGVLIAQGQSSATVDVTSSTSAGSVIVTASSPGSSPGTATVDVTLRALSVSLAASSVTVNQTVMGTVTLALPAPAGGVTVSLGSSNVAVVFALVPSVVVAQGSHTATFTVFGTGIGNANVLASAPGFTGASAAVTSTLTMTLGPSPLEVERAATRIATLSLNAPAPAGGLVVSLSSDDPTRATVPASVTVPAGLSLVDFLVTGVAEGQTTIRASAAGVQGATLAVSVTPPSAAAIDSSPANGEGSVAVTRETILRFSRALANPELITPQTLSAQFGGAVLPARIHVAPDRRAVTLFYLQTLPASARVRVRFDTAGLVDELGVPLDGNRDGQPGGTALIDFDTLTLTTLPGTAVLGRIFASQLGDGGINTPLAGVVISVDGLETTLRTTTDAMGNFRLEPAPVGEFFVHIDGRAATNGVPVGAYYPVVGKKWESKAQQATTISDVFLPLIAPGTLQPVSQTQDTVVTFTADVVAQDPRLAGVTLTVPANSLYADSGARGGMVGIAPVAPDRIPSPLPPGLNLPLVITVQTDGATNFDRPVPVCFPNLPDPATGQTLGAGDKTALWSFNHDIGDWEIVGPMTVSTNGALACSDSGIGIRQPGWHGAAPGAQGDSGDASSQVDQSPRPNGSGLTHAQIRQRRANCLIFGSLAVPSFIISDVLVNKGLGQIKAECTDSSNTIAKFFCGLIPGDVDIESRAGEAFETAEACVAYWDRQEELFFEGQAFPTSRGETAARALNDRTRLYLAQSAQAAAIVGPAARPEQLTDQQTEQLVALLPPYFSNLDEKTPAQFFVGSVEQVGEILASEDTIGGIDAGQLHYRLQSGGTAALTSRGTTSSHGMLQRLVLAPNTSYVLQAFDPASTNTALVAFSSAESGVPVRLPPFLLSQSLVPDLDGDGIDDLGESILGTNPSVRDSDGDGISDLVEVQAGSNPSDGLPVQSGLVATAETSGTAVDVATRNDIAVVADSDRGISVLNAAVGPNPVVVAQVDTPGAAQAVAFEGTLVAVADGQAGLAIVDISDPPAARIVRQLGHSVIGGGATAVAVAGGTAYVGLDVNRIAVVDLATGALLETVTLPTLAAVEDLAIERDTLYVLTFGQLHAVSLTAPLQVGGSAPSPGSRRASSRRFRLSAGGGIAYAVHPAGYNTFDLSVPLQPVLITASETPTFGWKHVVPNGSGLGVAAVGPNTTEDGPNHVSVYDISDPLQTNRFLAEFETPGTAAAVSIYNGVAYVADSQAGLQVINYLAPDRNGVPPTIALESNFALSGLSGVAEEGKVMRLTANVGDDVQVRNVEFFVNGVLVARDGNFPFEHRFTTPLLAVGSFSVRACAADTGGNRTCTPDVTISLVADATPPRVVRVSPPNGSRHALGTIDVLATTFNESVDGSSISAATYQLFEAGPDQQAGTADDVPVTAGVVTFNAQSATALLSFAAPLAAGNYRAVMSGAIRDVVGLAMGADFSWAFTVRDTKRWIVDTSGFWDDGANWSGGTAPEAGDLVEIDRPGGSPVVTIRTATPTITSIRSEEALRIESALAVDGSVVLNGGLDLAGTLTSGDATVASLTMAVGATTSGTGQLTVLGATTLTGGRFDGKAVRLGPSTLWTGASDFQLVNGASITNPAGAVWTIDAAASLTRSAGNSTATNQGTLRKIGAGITRLRLPFDNSGAVDVQSGELEFGFIGAAASSTGSFSGGPNTVMSFDDYTFAATSTVSSQGIVRVGAVDVSGTFAANQLTAVAAARGFVPAVFRSNPSSLAVLRLESGAVTFFGSTPLTVGLLQFEGGAIDQGPTTINATTVEWNRGGLGSSSGFDGVVNVAGVTTFANTVPFGAAISGTGATLRLGTQTIFIDGAQFVMGAGTSIINPSGGTLDWEGSLALTFNSGGGSGPAVLRNEGTLRKLGTGMASVTGPVVDNRGAIALLGGELRVNGGGTQTGTLSTADDTQLRMTGVTFGATSVVNAIGPIEIGGTSSVDGAFTAPLTLLPGSDVTFNVTPTASTFVSRGTARFNVPGSTALPSLQIEDGQVLSAASLSVGAFTWAGGYLQVPSLTVSGAAHLVAATGLQAQALDGVALTLGSSTQVADGVSVAAFGTVSILNPAGASMEISGNATMCDGVASCTFTNAGNLGFVAGPGRLTIGTNGDQSFSNSGTVMLRLASVSAHDTIATTGAAAFAGTLDVTTTGGFVPASGDIFSLAVYGSSTGLFANVLGNGETYIANYGATTLTLTKP